MSTWLANSHEVDLGSTHTSYTMSVDAIAEDSGGSQVASSFSMARQCRELLPSRQLGEEAATWAVSLLGGASVESGERPVVLTPPAAGQMLAFIKDALDGERVRQGASFLAQKLDTQMASELLNLEEDPFLPASTGSALWDGEGVPTQRKRVIERGVLKHYLHTLRSSHRAGVGPTGNAKRPGYSSLPTIGTYNLHIVNGETAVAELLDGIDEGLLVHDLTEAGLDSDSGIFSAGARGWRISDGKVAEPFSKVTVAGGMLDLLHVIDGVGDDLDLTRPFYSPTIRIGKMTVYGR